MVMAVFGSKPYCKKQAGQFKRFCPTLLLFLLLSACQQTTPIVSAETPLQALAPIESLSLEWADTAQERQTGLMNRAVLPDNSGMMFVFEEIKPHCFWMKNTLIPLDVGFIDTQGRLVQIESMQAQTTQIHCPNQAIEYALEVNQGWFSKHNVTVGMHLLKKR
jgi:hypothetical protein